MKKRFGKGQKVSVLLFIITFTFALYTSYLTFITSQKYATDKHLVLLAQRFTEKHIALLPDERLPLGDVADYFHNFYLYFGPFPSLALMPFVMVFGEHIPQSILGIGSLIVSFFCIYQISRVFSFTRIDSLWLALFFTCSTVLLSSSLINISAYQVEALTVPLILLSVREYFTKKRPFLIGLFLGATLLTRAVLVLAIVFFVIEFTKKRITARQLLLLSLPVIGAGLLFGMYNMRRFHSFTETGYKYNMTLHTYPLSENLSYGYMHPIHIPANLYSFLLMPPQPVTKDSHGFVLTFPYVKANPWGMAIWYTSPLFMMVIIRFRTNKYTLPAGITMFVLSVPLFLYYSIGFAQFGYRYTLDFLPFLFLLLLPCLSGKLSRGSIALIIMGVLFNGIYITSLWGDYPLFGIHI